MLDYKTEKLNQEEMSAQYVIFSLNGQDFGINVLNIREILEAQSLTKIPESPTYVMGVIDLRDKIIPVIDLVKRFKLGNGQSKQRNKNIIIAADDTLLGLSVEEVREIIRINTTEISEIPEITENIQKKYIEGIARLDNSLLVLLDVDCIFSSRDLQELRDIEA